MNFVRIETEKFEELKELQKAYKIVMWKCTKQLVLRFH